MLWQCKSVTLSTQKLLQKRKRAKCHLLEWEQVACPLLLFKSRHFSPANPCHWRKHINICSRAGTRCAKPWPPASTDTISRFKNTNASSSMSRDPFSGINIQSFCSMGNINCSAWNKLHVFLGGILMRPPPSFPLRLRVKEKKQNNIPTSLHQPCIIMAQSR